MDRASTSSRGDFYTTDPQSTESPDPETRGRKRRRDPLNPFSLPRHKPSAESSTLRGRCRHRSTSRMHLVTTMTAATAAAAHTTSHRTGRDSPELLSPAAAAENYRRSKSPSRSRSPGASHVEAEAVPIVMGQRRRQTRRQRTQSRGRRQGLKGALASAAQTGRPNLGFEEWVKEDGGMGKD
ncbi:hypothetical protein N0V93_007519 [Gnomoniopsis smithogilvyi]|uniref:Uncharacterized protein n=1 Tax=Gnomoniopsis smithogilvyi TaxID=1191159 RepID=A0A9W8YRR5_9PEZI|nr:hypothetical protein N0V93_007519 [Gnomoniopsis smithogilvyi]